MSSLLIPRPSLCAGMMRLPAARSRHSVAEVPGPCRDHRGTGGVDVREHLRVAHRAAGLDDRRHAGLEEDARAVGEREERVARGDRAGRTGLALELAGLLDRPAAGVDAADLAATETHEHPVTHEEDRVRDDAAAEAPREI